MQHLQPSVFGVSDDICKIAAQETHLEDVLLTEFQFVLYVFHYSRCCRGCKRKHRFSWQTVPKLGYLQVRGAEVISPLGDAVSFVNGDEADVYVSEFGQE